LGDPDWIQQGSLFKEYSPGEYAVEAQTGFNPDGSIAFDAGDPMFEIVWQRPEDYNLGTGLADPYSGGYSGQANTAREALQSRVYIATKVVSELHQGKFTQQVEGSLFQFPTPEGTNAANAAAARAEQQARSDAGRPATAPPPPRGAPQSDAQRDFGRGRGDNRGRGFIAPEPPGQQPQTQAPAQGNDQQPPVQPAKPQAVLTSAEIQNSALFKAGINANLTPAAAARLVREDAAARQQGAAVDSNGQPVATQAAGAPNRLPPAAGPGGLTDAQKAAIAQAVKDPNNLQRQPGANRATPQVGARENG
jgi:hypothetical protein